MLCTVLEGPGDLSLHTQVWFLRFWYLGVPRRIIDIWRDNSVCWPHLKQNDELPCPLPSKQEPSCNQNDWKTPQMAQSTRWLPADPSLTPGGPFPRDKVLATAYPAASTTHRIETEAGVVLREMCKMLSDNIQR